MKNTLSKAERLCSKKWIELLYKEGTSFRLYPLKVYILPHAYQTEFPVMIMVSSPKHLFKHAHDRNLTKRRMRESYRKNKHSLIDQCNIQEMKYFISFQYATKKIEPSNIIESSIIKALQKIELELLKSDFKS
jgi:ribonuclease P protein component